jgi:hypothetical protein
MKKKFKLLLGSLVCLCTFTLIFSAASPIIFSGEAPKTAPQASEVEIPAIEGGVETIEAANFFSSPDIPREELSESTKNESYTGMLPRITVLASGLGTNASVWSPDASGRLVYDRYSLIEQLRLRYDGVVYYAQTGAKTEEGYDIKFWNLAKNNYQYGGEYGYLASLQSIPYANHIILVFEGRQGSAVDEEHPNTVITYNLESNADAYDEFDYFMDKVFYERNGSALGLTFNLIGYDRGGALNMMYTAEHPFNVAKIFSVGTPYEGSNLAAQEKLSSFYGKILNSPGGQDMMSEDVQVALRAGWNQAYAANPNIEAHALGGMANMDYFYYMIYDPGIQEKYFPSGFVDPSKDVFDQFLQIALNNFILNSQQHYIGTQLIAVLPKLLMNLGVEEARKAVELLSELSLLSLITESDYYINGSNLTGAPDYTSFATGDYISFEEIINLLNAYNSVQDAFAPSDRPILLDDLFIDLDSQLAAGYQNITRAAAVQGLYSFDAYDIDVWDYNYQYNFQTGRWDPIRSNNTWLHRAPDFVPMFDVPIAHDSLPTNVNIVNYIIYNI